jgi:hypothetical protein
VYAKILALGFNTDSLILKASAYRVITEWMESPELQSALLRTIVSFAVDVNEPGHGATALGMMLTVPTIGFNRGGTHRIAHAAHQVLTQLGCEFHITKEVEKAIIENGRVTGIRLADGTEVAARKLVVSTLSPHQLIFDLIGREHVDDVTARRVELLKRNFGCLMWYTLAVHEAPRYRAEAFNPESSWAPTAWSIPATRLRGSTPCTRSSWGSPSPCIRRQNGWSCEDVTPTS